MHVPYTMLEPDTLRNLVESFVSREGTDYGEHEVAFATKVEQVLRQLRSGRAQVVFDAESESCSIVATS